MNDLKQWREYRVEFDLDNLIVTVIVDSNLDRDGIIETAREVAAGYLLPPRLFDEALSVNVEMIGTYATGGAYRHPADEGDVCQNGTPIKFCTVECCPDVWAAQEGDS